MVFSTKIVGIIISLLETFGKEVEDLTLFLNLDLGLSIVEFILIIALLIYFFKTLSKINKNSSRIVELLEAQSKIKTFEENVEKTVEETVEETVEKTEE